MKRVAGFVLYALLLLLFVPVAILADFFGTFRKVLASGLDRLLTWR
jgi:hypothetical protein